MQYFTPLQEHMARRSALTSEQNRKILRCSLSSGVFAFIGCQGNFDTEALPVFIQIARRFTGLERPPVSHPGPTRASDIHSVAFATAAAECAIGVSQSGCAETVLIALKRRSSFWATNATVPNYNCRSGGAARGLPSATIRALIHDQGP